MGGVVRGAKRKCIERIFKLGATERGKERAEYSESQGRMGTSDGQVRLWKG